MVNILTKMRKKASGITSNKVFLKFEKYFTELYIVFWYAVGMATPAFAEETKNTNLADGEDYKSNVSNVLGQIIDIIGYIFRAVGIILCVYSIGQLILAIKNEDADSKTRATTQIIVSVVLIALPSIINTLNLKGMLSGTGVG